MKHAIVKALRQEGAPVRILLPLADNPACAVIFRNIAHDLEAERVPGLLAEFQVEALGDAYLVALTTPITVAILFLDTNRERTATVPRLTVINPDTLRPNLPEPPNGLINIWLLETIFYGGCGQRSMFRNRHEAQNKDTGKEAQIIMF